MSSNWLRTLTVCMLGVMLVAMPAYAVATKKLTISGPAHSKPRVRVQATTPSGQVDVPTQQDDDRDNRVAGFIPEDASSVTVTNLDTGRSAEVSGPFTSDRDVSLAGLGLLAAGAGSAAGGSSSSAYNFLDSTELILSGGIATGIGSTGGNVRSNFADTSGSVDHLGGGSFNVLLRSYLPFSPMGIRMGGFFEYDEFLGVDGTSGAGTHHFAPNDTRVVRGVNRAFGFGFTQVIPVGMGFFIDLQQGLAVVRQSIEGVTDQSSGGGPTERFRKEFTSLSPKLGASVEYQPSNWPVRIRLASEFIYLPNAGVNGFANFSSSPFAFSSRGQWLAINTVGLVIPLNAFRTLMAH